MNTNSLLFNKATDILLQFCKVTFRHAGPAEEAGGKINEACSAYIALGHWKRVIHLEELGNLAVDNLGSEYCIAGISVARRLDVGVTGARGDPDL